MAPHAGSELLCLPVHSCCRYRTLPLAPTAAVFAAALAASAPCCRGCRVGALPCATMQTRLLPQGKVDPARRNYITIFSEMLEHKQVGGVDVGCGRLRKLLFS